MRVKLDMLVALAAFAVVGACQSQSGPSDRLARATPPGETAPSASTPAPAAPTAPSSASSSASSADTSMTGSGSQPAPRTSTPATGAGADVSGTTPRVEPGAPATAGATAAAPPPAAVALNEVTNPKTTLKGAKVMDMKGEAVGEVKTVKVDAAGKVTALDVAVGTRTIALQADGVRYVAADKMLISDRPKSDIVR